VYKSIKFRKSPPAPLILWTLAERFSWTLDYIRSIRLPDMLEFYAVEEGREKARPPKKPGKQG
jgi:hypothetical protein